MKKLLIVARISGMLFSVVVMLTVLGLCLTGCQTTRPEPVVVTKLQYVVDEPPDDLLVDCQVASPPDIATYIALDAQAKEGVLTDLYKQSVVDALACNARWAQLRQRKIDQLKLYSAPAASAASTP